MLANVAFSLRDQLRNAILTPEKLEEALLAAGDVISRYVRETPFQRENEKGEIVDVAPVVLIPDVLKCKQAYPKLKFTVEQERIDDARDMIKSIDTKAPSMLGIPFNQLALCDEEKCMIVISGGVDLVCENAMEMAKLPARETPVSLPSKMPTPNGAVQ